MRKFLGPAGGLISLHAKQHLKCPAAIIQLRAAVAKLKPVRELRPQPLMLKALAIGGGGMLLNVPAGMWRFHLKKFSPGWFVAVHACIPFVAVLRKAVILPKWTIALTIATAIAGQMVGSRLERYRLACLEQQSGRAALHGVAGLGLAVEPFGEERDWHSPIVPKPAGLLGQPCCVVQQCVEPSRSFVLQLVTA